MRTEFKSKSSPNKAFFLGLVCFDHNEKSSKTAVFVTILDQVMEFDLRDDVNGFGE